MTDGIFYVPVLSAWLIPSSLSKKTLADTKAAGGKNVVHLEVPPRERTPRLKESKIQMPVFLNLTLGALTMKADAKEGCPSTLSYPLAFDEIMLRAAATLRISAECRPTSEQLIKFSDFFSIPAKFGSGVYRLLLDRVVRRFETKIKIDALPTALKQAGDGDVVWKAHTSAWRLGTSLLGWRS
ncbi:hypothetical protein EJ03DRAFT_331457 [Teratosphaeria nubilosa]|uniref:Uncharacterized protein n=1 Tax=Teratosphaeria nubilosa TaxID=161662 RepID=A0A6G1KWA2_9PEZI|nr:hypothetical protein EJ03DRAFT_331457 [Teratosphaeria nubilosa]